MKANAIVAATAIAVGLLPLGVRSAAAVDAAAVTESCAGTFSPGLTVLPTPQNWSASCQGAVICSMSGSTTFGENYWYGEGINSGCDIGGNYERAGSHWSFRRSGVAVMECLFLPDQTPPAVVTTFHLDCGRVVT